MQPSPVEEHFDVVEHGPTRVGARNKFYAYCSIGQQTQDLKYLGEPTYLEIGDENSFREFVTMSAAEFVFVRCCSLLAPPE